MTILRALACTLSLGVLTSCWFTETRPNPEIDRPSLEDPDVEGEGPEDPGQDPQFARADGFTHIPLVGGFQETDLPLPPEPLVAATPQGTTIVAMSPATPFASSAALLRLSIPHRDPLGDQAGIARVAARALIESPRVEVSKPSLRETIERRGGRIDIDSNGTVTTFTLEVPSNTWKASLSELVSTIERRPTTTQVRTAQRLELLRLGEEIRTDAHATFVHRVLYSLDRSKSPLQALQDLEPSRVGVFLHATYRPSGAVLAVVAPGGAARVAATAKQAITPWIDEFEPVAATPTAPLMHPQAVYWATTDATQTEVTAVYDVPVPVDGTLTALNIATEAIVGDGGSGRLRSAVDRLLGRGTYYTVEWTSQGPIQSVLVRATMAPAQVPVFMQATDDALASATRDPLSKEEIATASARLRLRSLRDLGSPRHAVDTLSRYYLSFPQLPPPLVSSIAFAIDQTAAGQDFDQALVAMTARLPSFIATGGQPPEEFAERSIVQVLGELETADSVRIPTATQDTQRVGAEFHLERAFEALGGKFKLLLVDGSTSESVTRTGRGPAAGELTLYDRKNKRFRRIRGVLNASIETLIDGPRRTETSGDESFELTPAEADKIFADLERHPVFLLARAAAGTDQYLFISNRRFDDRSFAVLERVSDSNDRLRIFIDTESRLIRRVESIVELPGIGTANLVEHYRDYRNSGDAAVVVRTPHIRTSIFDGTRTGTLTVWTKFVIGAPPPATFEIQTK